MVQNRDAILRRIAIVDGARTPWSKAGGLLKPLNVVQLGGLAIRELLARTQLPPDEIDEVILGCVGQPSHAQNAARAAAIWAGVPQKVPAVTVHRNCASGFESITTAAERILTGQGEVYIAGGAESMSNYPIMYPDSFSDWLAGLSKCKTPAAKLAHLATFRPKMLKPKIGILLGLTDYSCGLMMGKTAENLAVEFGISREEQDDFALASHRKAAAATERRAAEIFPVAVPPYKHFATEDDGVRKDQTIEALAKLKPFFDRKSGTVTVGNSCPITDGAAAVLVMSEERAKAMGYKPKAYLRAWSYAGLDPARMGLGPVFATSKLLEREKMRFADIELIELNEAFSAQVIACERAFNSQKFAEAELGRSLAVGELRRDILNVNGGAVALGHPVGATGARLVLTLIEELARRGQSLGLATLCIGGGQGGALLLERH